LLSVQEKTAEWGYRRITLNQSTDHLRAPIDFNISRSIDEIQIESRLSEIQKLILNQNEQLFQQQQQLDGLARGFLDIVQVLQQKGDPTKKIEETNQSVIILGNALVDFKKQLKQANFGQEFADLKTQQQAIGKSVVTTRKTIDSQTQNLASYLGWKRIMMIVASTAVISSLCNIAIASLAPWAIGQIPGKSQPNNIEKSPPIVKKQKGDRSR
jgi:orotate phosphoribosyltransferase-like protein